MIEKLKTASEYIQSKIGDNTPRIAVVLGSGLGSYIDSIQNKIEIPYSEIPYFHDTSVEGHKGKLIFCIKEDIPIIILQGRLHAYEGYDMHEVVFPIRTLSMLGIETLILTNAAGGIGDHKKTGDLVLIDDHINLTGKNPLIGPNINELGPRFPDMTKAYDQNLKDIFIETANNLEINLKKGIYCSVLGPTYETPAEVRMLKTLGADMVGMSTVPESIAANHIGLNVVGISCITNMAAGLNDKELKHSDIEEMGKKLLNKFADLLNNSLVKIDKLD
jgi:purine-nucleoside phosphorylase